MNEGSDFDKNLFYRACACCISFLFAVGKGEEAVRQQKARAESDPENPKEMDLLIVSYIYADKIGDAYECFLKAVEKFPRNFVKMALILKQTWLKKVQKGWI